MRVAGIMVMLAASHAAATEVVLTSDVIDVTGVSKSNWLTLMGAYWPGSTPGQFDELQCNQAEVVRCTYSEIVRLTAEGYADALAAGSHIDTRPHGIAASNDSAHCHVRWPSIILTPSQLTELQSLVVATFGIAAGTCRRFILRQEGGEMIGWIEHLYEMTDEELLACLKNGTCSSP